MKYFATGMAAAGLLSGLLVSNSALADSQYQADRAYCMSSEAQESRTLCLKEAAAAQAERQRGSHATSAHRPHHAKPGQASPSGSGASAPA
jgi:hypothetical protein